MSAHRQIFVPVPLEPAARRRRRQPTGLWLLLALFIVITLATKAFVDAVEGRQQQAALDAAHQVAFEPPPPDLTGVDPAAVARIRLEAFRAGYKEAQENNCRVALATPLEQRP